MKWNELSNDQIVALTTTVVVLVIFLLLSLLQRAS